MNQNTTLPNEQDVKEFLRLLSFGLVKGVGVQEEGKMCIEACWCAVLKLPNGDNPPCVGSEVRACKIALNDCDWSSKKARAEGMKLIGIAQVGSNQLNQQGFFSLLKLNSTKRILPYLIQKHYDDTKDERLLEYKVKFESLDTLNDSLWREFYYNYYFNHYNYYYNSYYYSYSYNYYYSYYYYNYGDEFLLLVADVILQTLKEMNSPGCQYLYLAEQERLSTTSGGQTGAPPAATT